MRKHRAGNIKESQFTINEYGVLFSVTLLCVLATGIFIRVGSAQSSAQAVIWINKVNVTAIGTGNSLQKTSGCDWCSDAGATSQQTIPSGNGYMEFTVSETNTLRTSGLSNGNTDTSSADIDFAISLNGAGSAEVRENGTWKKDIPYITGDVFRVAVENGSIKYYKNGTAFHPSGLTPTYPLLVDTSLQNSNAT
ncbi:MAG: hypothetical protein ABR577_18965, partial [Pyrinomonadaceae bacterium]